MTHARNMIADRPVSVRAILPFFVIAFGLAWTILGLYVFASEWMVPRFGEISGQHPLFLLAVYSPAIAAATVVLSSAGLAGFGRYLKRLFMARLPGYWWLFLLAGIPALFFAGSLAKGNAMTAPLFSEPLAALIPAMAFMTILGPIEEFGWRGVALPLMQRRLAPFWAGLVLGIVWSLWHLPAFFLGGTPQGEWGFLPFFAGSVAASVILTSMFNRSGGSILIAMLFHYQLINPLWPDAQPHDTLFFVAAAMLVTWLDRAAMFDRGGGVTDVVP